MSRTLLAAALAALSLVQGDARRADRAVFDPAPALAAAADADGDGATSAAEWADFVSALPADASGALDVHGLALRTLRLDEDGDGALDLDDLERAFASAARGRGFLALLVCELVDADGDGVVSEAERARFRAAARPASGDAIDEALARDWLRRAEANPPADRNAMTAGVLLASLRASLDADADGRTTAADLHALHRALDADGDGAISAEEVAARLRRPEAFPGGAESRWAVSDESRARPPLVPWQRDLDDALALSRATGKPLLLCVNMDGENASEQLAFGRYRDPAFAELARGFVPLLASPDRHAPRERDDRGRRVADPRFGRLICSEHVDVEPLLYERWFDGRRVAPRHVGVSAAGEVLFDVFLVQDLSLVDAKLREHGLPGALGPDPATLSEDALLESPDAACRDELERRCVEGDERTRARLAALALSDVRATQHPELVRLALRDPSAAVRREGAWAIARHLDRAPLDALPQAFAATRAQPALRAALVEALREPARRAKEPERSARARLLLRTFTELDRPSPAVDAERWRLALAAATPVVELPVDPAAFDDTVAAVFDLTARQAARPADVALAVELAAAHARLARIQLARGGDPSLSLEDAARAAADALELEPANGKALGLSAWASYMLSDLEAAGASAARALPALVEDAGSPLAREVLGILATVRTRAIHDALAAGEPWPEGALSDAVGAYEALTRHPGGTEAHWTAYLDLLGALEAYGEQAALVRRGLAREPLSGVFHPSLLAQVLRDAGARALEAFYEDERAGAPEAELPARDWFHGLATLVAAEQDAQNLHPDDALAAYERSIERFARSYEAAPDYASSARHYQCLAHAGRARILLERNALDRAVDELVAAAEASPASFESPDGQGRTPAETARELRNALRRAGADELARRLDEARADSGG